MTGGAVFTCSHVWRSHKPIGAAWIPTCESDGVIWGWLRLGHRQSSPSSSLSLTGKWWVSSHVSRTHVDAFALVWHLFRWPRCAFLFLDCFYNKPRTHRDTAAMSSLRILAAAFFLLHEFPNSSVSKAASTEDGANKVGAGLFLLNDEFAGGDPHVLLLKRSKETNHPKTWSLPGGNYDAQLDRDLYETALREAREELGGIPDIMSVRGSILVKWGNDNDNEYTVFVVETVRSRRRQRCSLPSSHPPFLPHPFAYARSPDGQ